MKQVMMDEVMDMMGADHRMESLDWRTHFDYNIHKTVVRPSLRDRILGAVRVTGATHLVVFENRDSWSSQLGAKTVVCVGPGCTYRTPEDCEGKWLNDQPSQRQYAAVWCEVEKVVTP
jgi:hypothetical protein